MCPPCHCLGLGFGGEGILGIPKVVPWAAGLSQAVGKKKTDLLEYHQDMGRVVLLHCGSGRSRAAPKWSGRSLVGTGDSAPPSQLDSSPCSIFPAQGPPLCVQQRHARWEQGVARPGPFSQGWSPQKTATDLCQGKRAARH